MSKVDDEFILDLAVDDASWACRDALTSIGWNIKEMDANRIVPKIGMGLTRNPSKIEVLLADAGGSQTRITLKGSIAASARSRRITSEAR